MKSIKTSLYTLILILSPFTNTTPAGREQAPDMDPLAMMSLMGGMGGGLPGMPGMGGGLPGASQFADIKKLVASLTSKVPTRKELFDKSNKIRHNLRNYNRERNLPFLRRAERLYLKLSLLPDFSSLEDLRKPKPPLSDETLLRYDRHLRCLESLAAVNEEGKEKEYEVVLAQLIQRYDLLQQLGTLSARQKVVRTAYADLCRSDQEKFHDEYSRQRSLLAQQVNELTAKLIPLEVALCIDRRSWLETYGSSIVKVVSFIGGLWTLRLLFGGIPSWGAIKQKMWS